MNRNNKIKNLVIAALFVAVGLILPYFFHMFGGEAGVIFDPMDLPVLLCGLILGWRYGLGVGIILPLLSGVLTGMPPIFPVAIAMAVQLGILGLITGILRNKINSVLNVIIAEIIGGVIYSIVMAILIGIAHNHFGITGPLVGTFVTGLPGIILQIIVVPILAKILKKSGAYNG